MPISRIADLPAPVTAAKADWLVASHWLGFTPPSNSPRAVQQCQATVARQAGNGYVLEYVTANFGEPNPGYQRDPKYLAEKRAHRDVAGRLVAIHRLRATARHLREIIGEADFERIQDMWAQEGRRRWSVAFPIVESYEITSKPHAKEVFGRETMLRLFGHPSATLRPLNDIERQAIANLPIASRETANAWIAIEDEIANAEQSTIEKRIIVSIGHDLGVAAMEGFTIEQRGKLRLRAAWLAQRFVQQRQKTGTLFCDDCRFDPADRIKGEPIKPRSLLDVHHRNPLEEGRRMTTLADFALLCPTCHRVEHALLRARKNA